MSQKFNTVIAVVGIDIGKNSFHIVGHDERGAIVLRQRWSRGQVETRLANMPPCLIGMEACVGAHHLSRRLKALARKPRLQPAEFFDHQCKKTFATISANCCLQDQAVQLPMKTGITLENRSGVPYASALWCNAIEHAFNRRCPMPDRPSDDEVGRQILDIFARHRIPAGGVLRAKLFFQRARW